MAWSDLYSPSFELTHWTYDDGSVAVELIQENGGKQKTRTKKYTLLEGVDAYHKYLENLSKQRGMSKFCKDVAVKGEILCGVRYIDYPSVTVEPTRFPKIIRTFLLDQSYEAQSAVFSIFSAVLASYVSWLFQKELFGKGHKQDMSFRAPLISIPDHQTFEILRIIIEAIAVDTTPPEIELEGKEPSSPDFLQPAVIQATRRNARISDYTSLCARKKSHLDSEEDEFARKKELPSQYRDTAVLIETRDFTKKDLQEFQYRNRWATIFLYAPTPKVPIMEPIKLDSKPLQTFSADEQLSKKLHSIMQLFLNWLVDRPKELDLDGVKQEAEERIARYNKRPKTKSYLGHRKAWMLAQLVGTRFFLEFLHSVGSIDISTLKTDWWDILLPPAGKRIATEERTAAVAQPPEDSEERIIAPKPNSKEVFEETITEILRRGLGSTIPFRPSNSKLPVGETWGCLRVHGKQEPRRVFAISTRQLDLLAQDCCPDSCDWQMILLDMRRKPPAYLLPVKNCRVFGISKAENSVLIDIDKARFLPQEMRTTIKKMFQGIS